MRAIVCAGFGDESVLRLSDVPEPALGRDEVRLRVVSTSVNRADLLQRRGLYPPPPGTTDVLGLECAGVVLEVGPRVSSVRPGERVMALLAGGGYAEQVVTDVRTLLGAPDALSDDEAGAFMEVFLTAFSNLFWLAGVTRGDAVLVHGGGSGVGTAAIALCKEAGVEVMVTAGSAEKCQRCIELGATVAIDYRAEDFVERVRQATSSTGVTAVLDIIGAPYLERNLACLRPGGRLLLIGLQGGNKAEINLAALLSRRTSIVGSTLRGRPTDEKGAIVSAFTRQFGTALEAGRLRPVMHTSFPLAQVADAHRLVQSGKHFGKVGLRVAAHPP
jgi:putative PIG3 family NAD(P)H quinone oxidoreductase